MRSDTTNSNNNNRHHHRRARKRWHDDKYEPKWCIRKVNVAVCTLLRWRTLLIAACAVACNLFELSCSYSRCSLLGFLTFYYIIQVFRHPRRIAAIWWYFIRWCDSIQRSIRSQLKCNHLMAFIAPSTSPRFGPQMTVFVTVELTISRRFVFRLSLSRFSIVRSTVMSLSIWFVYTHHFSIFCACACAAHVKQSK